MATNGSGSRAFNPPVNTVKDSDPQIVRVPMDKTDWGNRKSQQPALQSGWQTLSHIPNQR